MEYNMVMMLALVITSSILLNLNLYRIRKIPNPSYGI